MSQTKWIDRPEFDALAASLNSRLAAKSDIEIGTKIVAFASGGGSVTIHASYKTLTYVKLGRLVVVTGTLVAGSVSSPSGALTITGLPFTASLHSPIVVRATGLTTGSGTAIHGYVEASSTTMHVARYSDGNEVDDLAAFMAGSSGFNITAIYLTS